MPEPVLTLSGVSKSFPGVQALRDITLSLQAGRVTAIIGENPQDFGVSLQPLSTYTK